MARDKSATTRRGFRALPRARGTIFFILLALIVEGCFHAFLPFSAGYFVDQVLAGKNRDMLALMLAIMGGGFVVSSMAGLLRDSLFARYQSRSLAGMRQTLFERLQHFSITFHGATPPEDVLECFTGDLGIIESAFTMTPTWGAMPTVECAVYTGTILWLDWRLGLLSILLWPWIVLAPRALTRQLDRASEVCKDEEVRILGVVQESLTARLVIRAFSLDHLGTALFRKRNDALQRNTRKAAYLTAMADRFTQSGILFIQMTILALSGLLAFDDQMTAGRLVSIPILTWLLAESLLLVSEYRPALSEAKAAWTRIQNVMRDPAPVLDIRDAKPMTPLQYEITYRSVSVSYGEQPALTDVTVAITRNGYVAFVGPVGSGKSTMLRALMRLIDPQSGAVAIDGYPIKSFTQTSLRARMGAVFPDNFIFNASVRENIRLGNPEASEEKMRDLVKKLGFVEQQTGLPQGMDTPVGENGIPLSGELRQRVALARALLRNPDILLLDEIEAPLEPAENLAIRATVHSLLRHRTLIRATNRLAEIMDADIIYVFDQGRIAEYGSHEELLAREGLYKATWAKQTGFHFSADGRSVEVELPRLKQLPVLDRLGDDLATELASYFVTESFAPDQEIVRRGDACDRLFVLVQGKADIDAFDEETGELIGTNVLEDGDSFGEIGLLADLPHEATVRAATVCTCISLSRGHFDRVIDRYPEVRHLMTETAAQLLRESIGEEPAAEPEAEAEPEAKPEAAPAAPEPEPDPEVKAEQPE